MSQYILFLDKKVLTENKCEKECAVHKFMGSIIAINLVLK
jgi:hypothetical protein